MVYVHQIPMSDDLANDWGCDLICMGRSSGRKRKVGATIAILADDRRQRNFHFLLRKQQIICLVDETNNERF